MFGAESSMPNATQLRESEMNNKTKLVVFLLLVACLAAVLGSALVEAEPQVPATFYGTVKINGENVPLYVLVEARVLGVTYATRQVQVSGADTVYVMDVPGDDPSTPGREGGQSGDTIQFYIGGLLSQAATWQQGVWNLNLTATGSLPTLTPTITGQPTSTPTVTLTRTRTPSVTSTPVVVDLTYDVTTIRDTTLNSWDQNPTPVSKWGTNFAINVRGDVMRGMMYFDTSALSAANATIRSAKLFLYLNDYLHQTNLSPLVSIYKVKQPWGEYEATWVNRTTGVAWGEWGCNATSDREKSTASGSTTVSANNRWYQWDITALVQDWVTSPAENRGMILISNQGRELRFWSKDVPDNWGESRYRPYLHVEYVAGTGPLATPTATLIPTGLPTVGPSPQSIEVRDISQDTYIDNWDKTSPHEARGLRLRGRGDKKSLLNFVLPPEIVFGSRIVSASLRLTTATGAEVGDSYPDLSLEVSAYLVTRQWEAATATWNFPWATAGCNNTASDRRGTPSGTTIVTAVTEPGRIVSYQWDVTSIVQAWVDDPFKTNTAGLVLIGTSANGREVGFRDSHYGETVFQPVLWVQWLSPEPTPAASFTPTQTPTPTLTPTPTSSPTATPSATPTLTPTDVGTPTPTATSSEGSIQGTVYDDHIGGIANGRRDPGELGLAGAEVQLWHAGDRITSQITTGSGSYSFPGLTPGSYTVMEIDPPGYRSSTSNERQAVVYTGRATEINFGDYDPSTVTPLLPVFLPFVER